MICRRFVQADLEVKFCSHSGRSAQSELNRTYAIHDAQGGPPPCTQYLPTLPYHPTTTRTRHYVQESTGPMNRPSQYTTWDILPLGDYPDPEIAREVGVTVAAVRAARLCRNIPAYVPPRHFNWDSVPLGQAPDREIAEQLGVQRSVVRAARQRRGISAYDGAVRSHANRGINWDLQPLGVTTDSEIALQLDVSPEAVGRARRRRGIPAYGVYQTWVNWESQPLGKVSDGALARQLGVSRQTVLRARQARQIPPLTPKAPRKYTENHPKPV